MQNAMFALKLRRKLSIPIKTRHFSNTKISTVDKNEIEFFDKLSDDWWNANGTMKLLLNMNQVRVPIIQKCLTDADLAHIAYAETSTPLRGIRLLDVGCGGGFLSEALAKLGADVTGVDASEDMLRTARQHMHLDPKLEQHLRYHSALIEDFSQTHRESFDAIVSSEVIEHVAEPDLFVKHCIRCLKPGGSIIFTTIDRTPIGGLLNIFFHEDVLKIMPKGTHDYTKFLRPSELRTMLHNHACKTVAVQGFTMNSFTANWFKMPVTWFNYALHAVKSRENVCKYAAAPLEGDEK